MNFIIHNLPVSCTPFDLYSLFFRFGRVKEVLMEDNIGYVSMTNIDEAIQAKITYCDSQRRVNIQDHPVVVKVGPPPTVLHNNVQLLERDQNIPSESIDKSKSDPVLKDMIEAYRSMNNDEYDNQNINSIPESFFHYDSNGFGRDPNFRPRIEYYYRIQDVDWRLSDS